MCVCFFFQRKTIIRGKKIWILRNNTFFKMKISKLFIYLFIYLWEKFYLFIYGIFILFFFDKHGSKLPRYSAG
jgi:hypothetical protein